jgi:hypothetical protein
LPNKVAARIGEARLLCMSMSAQSRSVAHALNRWMRTPSAA